MQISRSFLLVCAAAFCAALLPLRAADPDMQKQLQEALDKKLNELQSQPLAATPPAAVPTPKPAVATPKPKKKKPAPAPVLAPAAQPAPASSGGRPTPPAQWTPPPVAKPSPAAQPAPAPAAQATPQPALVVPTPVSPKSIDKARDDLRRKMKDLEAQQPAPTNAPAAPAAAPAPAVAKPAAAKPQPKASKPAVKPVVEKAPKKPAAVTGPRAFPPIEPPPPTISADKQQRLAELLRKYKAEEITPEEYHQQRAKIMSEP